MAECVECGKTLDYINTMPNGRCTTCHGKYLAEQIDPAMRAEFEANSQLSADSKSKQQAMQRRQKARSVVVTTETYVGDAVRLGIVASEVVLGMNIFRDIFANVRDVFGGRSGAVQQTLEDARRIAFDEIRAKAADLNADAVIAVDIDYHSISTGSAVNMMMVSVTGTAIQWPSKNSVSKNEA